MSKRDYPKLAKEYLNLTAEYRVCAELLKRSLFATITYGNKKGVDIFAIGEKRRVAVVEVKASNSNRFVTGFYQKYADQQATCPHFWVLYSVRQTGEDTFEERFFVLSHAEMAEAQRTQDRGEGRTYEEHAALVKNGVDNVSIGSIEKFENQWSKIIAHCKAAG